MLLSLHTSQKNIETNCQSVFTIAEMYTSANLRLPNGMVTDPMLSHSAFNPTEDCSHRSSVFKVWRYVG